MTQIQLQQLLVKYKNKYHLNKSNFIQFISSDVNLNSYQCQQFSQWLSAVVENNKEFGEDKLIQLLQLLSAFQKGYSAKQLTSLNFQARQQFKCIQQRKNTHHQQFITFNNHINNKQQQTQNPQNSQNNPQNPNSTPPTQPLSHKTTSQPPPSHQSQQQPPQSQLTLRQSTSTLQIVQFTSQVKQQIDILKYQKKGQDFINPVIKYLILYTHPINKNQYLTWRRYSEIEKLMTYLRDTYQGVVLPEMPPKQGLAGNINSLLKNNANEQFLQQRKQKLKQVLNRVLACQQVHADKILLQFLTNPSFQISSITNPQSSYLQTLLDVRDMVFNMNDLKCYSKAYWNFICEQKKQINTPCSNKYKQISSFISIIQSLNQHRITINNNFHKRRQIMYNTSIQVKGPTIISFDKILDDLNLQCQQLKTQYNRYLALKSTQYWQYFLKQQQFIKKQKLHDYFTKIQQRVKKMEINLLLSLNKFQQKYRGLFQEIHFKLIQWRNKVHP